MVFQVSFVFQSLCLAGFFIAYLLAVGAPTLLQDFYNNVVSFLEINRHWLAVVEINSAAFPHAGAHSVISIFLLIAAYATALLRSYKYLHCAVTWDPQDIGKLTERLRSIFISKVLVLPLASYVSANNARLFAPLVINSGNQRKTTVAAAWLRYFFSKAVLSIAVAEALLPVLLLVLAQASSRDSVGSFRYFTTNTLVIFFVCSLAFKLCLTVIALLDVYLKGENSYGDS